MIRTENGDVHFVGTGGEIAADLLAILDAALENVPLLLIAAVEEFGNSIEEQKNRQNEDNKQIRLEAFASMLSHLPKEELEELKKKANGED